MEADFVAGYNSGHRLHTLRQQVNYANNQINSKERALENTSKKMRVAEATMISADTTVQNRVLALADIKDLSEQTGQLEAEIDQLIEDRAISERRLAEYQAVVADSGF